MHAHLIKVSITGRPRDSNVNEPENTPKIEHTTWHGLPQTGDVELQVPPLRTTSASNSRGFPTKSTFRQIHEEFSSRLPHVPRAPKRNDKAQHGSACRPQINNAPPKRNSSNFFCTFPKRLGRETVHLKQLSEC